MLSVVVLTLTDHEKDSPWSHDRPQNKLWSGRYSHELSFELASMNVSTEFNKFPYGS